MKEREQFGTDSDIVQGSSRSSPKEETPAVSASSEESHANPATAVQRSHKFAHVVTQAVKHQGDGGDPAQ